MIVLRDGKLIDTPIRAAEAEIADGIAEAVTSYVGVKEVDIGTDSRYGPAPDPAGMIIRQTPAPDGSIRYIACDGGGVPIGPDRPLYAVARADARDFGQRQSELGMQVFSGKPAPPLTDGSEAIPPGSGVLGRGPVTTMPGPKPARARSSE
jgi:hypothetical protein